MTNKSRGNSRGYSLWMAQQVAEADPQLIGVQMAKVCIANNIPASKVAKDLGVSKQAVYAWFVGKFSPSALTLPKIHAWMKQHAA